MKFPDLDGFYRGARWKDKHGEVRVMGIVDHHVVYRRPRCAVQVAHYRDFLRDHERAVHLEPRWKR